MKKVVFISSCGGHMSELLQLKSLFDKYNYLLVTEKNKDTINLSKTYKTKYLAYATRKNLFKYAFVFPFNCLKSLGIFLSFKPDVVVTTGAHTSVPMCIIARLFGKKVIYIETMANRTKRTLTSKILYNRLIKVNYVVVQWEELLKLYPDAIYGGVIY